MKNLIKILIFSLFALTSYAQQATEIDSKSVKLPRYPHIVAIEAIPSPQPGMMVYNLASASNMYYNGTRWKGIVSAPMSLYHETTSPSQTTFSAIAAGTNSGSGYFSIENSLNPNPALSAHTWGNGDAIHAATSGTGYSFRATSHSGKPGFFEIGATTNHNTALQALTYGDGDAFSARTLGLGVAGYFSGTRALETDGEIRFAGSGVGTIAAGNVLTSDAFGNASWQAIPSVVAPLNLTSSVTTLTSTATGPTGFAGRFQSTNPANAAASVYSTSHGTGDAFMGVQYNAGNAASLVVSNNSSIYSAVYGESNGTGRTSWFKMLGTGKAGYFQIDNPLNSNTTFEATTNGLGTAGEFSNTNASASAPVVDVKNQGSGFGINIESQNAISADGFITNKGFTQLGELSPKIKTVTLGAYIGAGSVETITHNLNAGKILSINVYASLEDGLPPHLRIPPSFISLGTEYYYDYYFDDTKIYFIIPGSSTKVKNFFARVLISYTE